MYQTSPTPRWPHWFRGMAFVRGMFRNEGHQQKGKRIPSLQPRTPTSRLKEKKNTHDNHCCCQSMRHVTLCSSSHPTADVEPFGPSPFLCCPPYPKALGKIDRGSYDAVPGSSEREILRLKSLFSPHGSIVGAHNRIPRGWIS